MEIKLFESIGVKDPLNGIYFYKCWYISILKNSNDCIFIHVFYSIYSLMIYLVIFLHLLVTRQLLAQPMIMMDHARYSTLYRIFNGMLETKQKMALIINLKHFLPKEMPCNLMFNHNFLNRRFLNFTLC